MLFRRSASGKYQDRAPGLMGFLRADSTMVRLVVFIVMSAIFFLFLKITERKIPHDLSTDSTEVDTAHSINR